MFWLAFWLWRLPLSSRSLRAAAEAGVTEDTVAGSVIVETGVVMAAAGVTPVRDALLPPKRLRLPRILIPMITGTATGWTVTVLAAGTPTGAAGTAGTSGVTPVAGAMVAGPALLIRMLRRAVDGDPMVVVGAVVEAGVVAATEAGASPGVNTTKS